MKTVIDKEIIEKGGLTVDEFLLVMVLGNDIDLFKAAQELKAKNLVVSKYKPPFNVAPKQKLYDMYESIIIEASEMLDSPIRYEELAKKLIDIYPKGFKDGTYQWVEGPILIAKRLQAFELKYGKYSDESIINATQRYVNIMYGKPEMRLLKYFIFKEKNNSAGENESSSDLYNMLTNNDDTLFEAEKWKTEIL